MVDVTAARGSWSREDARRIASFRLCFAFRGYPLRCFLKSLDPIDSKGLAPIFDWENCMKSLQVIRNKGERKIEIGKIDRQVRTGSASWLARRELTRDREQGHWRVD